MSAIALANPDFAGSGSVAGPMAFSARKKAAEAADGKNSGDSFDAALAQSENETPSTASPGAGAPSALASARTASAADAPAAPTHFARDGGLERELSVVSGGGFTAIRSTASAGVSLEAPVGRTPRQANAPALDPLAKSLGSVVEDAPSPTDAKNESASARPIDRKALVPSLPQGGGTRVSTAAEPTEKASDPSRKSPAAHEADAVSTTGARRTKPAIAADPAAAPLPAAYAMSPAPTPGASSGMSSASPPIRSPAKAIASSRDEANFGGAAGGAGEGDSVARIGAALASVSRRATPFAGAEKSPVEAEVSLAAPDAAATYPIHVVAQKAWLQPVSPAFSPGLNRLAAADRAALEAPRAGKSAAPESRAEAAAANVPEAAPAARAEAAPLPSNAVAFSGGAAFFVDEDSAVAALAAKKPTVAPENASALPQAAAPRRDLEITLAPKDLGGLAVRIKSAGDRLELAFVADKGETARMISDKSATLESQLHGAGLGLGGIEIDAASRTDLGALGAPLASAGATANGAPADPRENSQSAPQRQEFSGRGRQDQSHETGEKSGEPLASSGNRGLYL